MAEAKKERSVPAKRKGVEGKSVSPVSKKKLKNDTQSSTSQKRALKHERQSHRKHADAVMASKEIWNKLRLKNNTPEETRELMEELMSLIRGKVNEIALQHDASRVVQAAVQFGTTDQRKEVVKELCASANLAELAKVQYAHFLLLKIIKYCYRDEECVRLVVKSLKGSIPKLAVHSVGSRVVELLFSTFPSKSTALLKQEFYGPHFTLFASADLKTSNPTLESNLEVFPEKKDSAMDFVLSIINKGMDKGLFGFVYFQQLFSEYVAVATPNEIRSLAPNVVDHSIHLLSTRAGTRVVVACASYGTAKDRKRIMKSLKGYTRSSLLHRDAYLAVLRIVQVTDDTVSVNKSVFAEILSNPKEEENEKSSLLDIALDESGSKLFLMLLVSKQEARQKYLDPCEREMLGPNPQVIEAGESVPTSKKNPETRRQELLQYMRKPLIDMCVRHANELARSIEGSRVLREVYASFASREVVDALLDACETEGMNGANEEEGTLSIFEDPVGHKAIKSILLSDSEETESVFASEFLRRFGDNLMGVGSTSRGAFVLTALLQVKSVQGEVQKKLGKQKKKIRTLSRGEKHNAGFEALLKVLK